MCFIYLIKCKAWLLSEGVVMTKYNTEFDVGDIIRYKKSKHNIDADYYLIMKIDKRFYTCLWFEDGVEYPLAKSDYYQYEKVS